MNENGTDVGEGGEAQVAPPEASDAPKPKRKRRKLFVGLGIAAAVIVVAAAGLWVWHEQPSFCSTMCHDVMTPYVESWENPDSLCGAHAQAGQACLDCHEPTIEDQLNELQVYASGKYRNPLIQMKVEDEFCERCHDRGELANAEMTIDYEALTPELKADLEAGGYKAADHPTVNPHIQTIGTNSNAPHGGDGQLPKCNACHNMHRGEGNTMNACTSCHHTNTYAPCSTCHEGK